MQFQSDVLGIPIVRPKISETTALGVAYLAGLATGYWNGIEDIKTQWEIDKKFVPITDPAEINKKIYFWNKAVSFSKNWLNENE